MSCLASFHEKLSRNCQLVSMRPRGSASVAPSEAIEEPSSGSFLIRIKGRPKSCGFDTPVSSPIDLGSNPRSWGEKLSVNRLYPNRASLTFVEDRTFRYESDTSWTRVGVTV